MAKLEDRRFDIRTLERNLRNGEITKAEYEKYLADLADGQDNAVKMESKFEVGVLNEDNEG